MPTYEYACGACGHQWDEVQRITEPPLEVCPKCTKAAAHRLISGGTRFILKGGGWYSDLYASPKAPSKGGEAKGLETKESGSSDGGGKSETKSETKTAAPSAGGTSAPSSPSTPSSS